MIYELTLFQRFGGQQCINRWNYLLTGTPAAVTGSFALIDAFGGVIPALTPGVFPEDTNMRYIQDLVSSGVQFEALMAKAVYDVTDFYELPYVPAPTGGAGGDSASPTVAFGFRSTRTRTDIRRGMKRFVGVPESAVTTAGSIASAVVPALEDLADGMAAALTYDDEGNTLTFTPIIVSKEPYTPSGSTSQSYRYYPTLAEQLDHIAQSILWQPYAQTRTQVSRQIGRGQ
jgi:hypothetical protein